MHTSSQWCSITVLCYMLGLQILKSLNKVSFVNNFCILYWNPTFKADFKITISPGPNLVGSPSIWIGVLMFKWIFIWPPYEEKNKILIINFEEPMQGGGKFAYLSNTNSISHTRLNLTEMNDTVYTDYFQHAIIVIRWCKIVFFVVTPRISSRTPTVRIRILKIKFQK